MNIVDKVVTYDKINLLIDDKFEENILASPVSSSFTMEFENEEKNITNKESRKKKNQS